MEAVMAEMAVEEEKQDIEDDNDFVNDKGEPTTTPSLFLCSPSYLPRTSWDLVEEDIFGSDFESTDEEAEKEAQEAGETEVFNEERKVKKVNPLLSLCCANQA